jgi:glycosyltransferase involved in cell wall biosynthesis
MVSLARPGSALPPKPRIAVVAIGRNEGERLRACLRSVVGEAALVVYVDSNSTDDSVAMARALGVDVIVLDPKTPFTAALARNAGWRRARELMPQVELIQFVDGDCAVQAGWMAQARDFLVQRPDMVAACGRRRERYPERSIYNLLCDLEWNSPIGEAKAFGGDVLVRADALDAVGGYRNDLIAGEEPELCVRLRAQGWKIQRLDAEMTLHDANILRFSQWWKRQMRAGFAYAQGAHLHGKLPERHKVKESRRAWLWGLGMPLVVLAAALLISPWALVALAIYPLQALRLYARSSGAPKTRAAHAVFMTIGKFAEAVGQLKFVARQLSGGPTRLIEYK